jgi:putative DNA primase/helicase
MVPGLFHEDVTPEGLAQEIATGWPSSSLWSDEGGLIVGSHGMSDDSAMRFLTLQNRLWDGNPFDRKRSTAKSCTIRGRRLTSCLMMQEVVLARLLNAAGGSARGTGFLARSLFCWPISTMGTRFYVEGDIEGPELRACDRRVCELLDLPLPAIGPEMILEPPVLYLSQGARQFWIEFHNEVESDIGKNGEHHLVADFASKSAEQAARIAAVQHVFEHGPDGEITAEEMAAGIKLATWYLFEARRMITAVDQPQEVADAVSLENWLLSRGENRIEFREILRLGPPQLRTKRRRDGAIAQLVDFGHATKIVISGRAHLYLNPRLGAGV